MKQILLKIIFVGIIFIPISFIRAETTKNEKPIKILIVPGHDDKNWGTEFRGVREADMNLALATQIYDSLKKDKRFDVYINRDSQGYTKEFSDYFSLQKDNIMSFETDAKNKQEEEIKNGTFVKKINVRHASAKPEVVTMLYGVDKWANENKMDAVLHIHFNDYPRDDTTKVGKYKGFTVYVPEKQMVNSKESINFGKSIFKQLSRKYISSTYEKEKGGFVEDQSLIALGSKGTLIDSVRSVLVEYGYIYQKIFNTWPKRKVAYKNMADLTVTGIKNYFFANKK